MRNDMDVIAYRTMFKLGSENVLMNALLTMSALLGFTRFDSVSWFGLVVLNTVSS